MSKSCTLAKPDEIRALFCSAMSEMYKAEVPQYRMLCDLVAQTNARVMEADAIVREQLQNGHQVDRLQVERHGAVRLGTACELATIGRMFAVMGMRPVGYYDLSVAGVPVHATAFRPVDEASLERNPFRVFTSLLRLELIADAALRESARVILQRREIFTPGCRDLLAAAESQGGLTRDQAEKFVAEALKTFRWHAEATVDLQTYRDLRAAHALVADIVCFKGPHINHLTPRTLDIDATQSAMADAGMRAKGSIEGPPPRAIPVLLRQTSFLALEEPIQFLGDDNCGTHTARFGEIEQRGCALTRKGRDLYDDLLAKAKLRSKGGEPLAQATKEAFKEFPDDVDSLYKQGLAFFRYRVDGARLSKQAPPSGASVGDLVADGWLQIELQTYEDFLPVSAAGIFRSNLGGESCECYENAGNREALEAALGAVVLDEMVLYANVQAQSFETALKLLGSCQPAVVA